MTAPMRLGRASRVAGLRALAIFWAAILCVGVAGAVALERLGPPDHAVSAVPVASPPSAPHEALAATVVPEAVQHLPPGPRITRPGRTSAGPIAGPDPALLEPSPDYPDKALPRIGADGRSPSQVYARGFDRGVVRPRIAIILAGVGMSGSDSEDAIHTLPGEVTLAFSPYASHPEHLLDMARAAGHEMLISLPMEPQGYPMNDAGDHALLTGASPEQNRLRLEWALSRIDGYAGATNALGVLRGERFAGASAQMEPVLQTLSGRGLFFVDARPGQPGPPDIWSRAADVVIDEPAVRTEIEAKLATLEQIARDKGSAVGIASAPRPVTVDRLAAWANGLTDRGLVLAPASALMREPETKVGAAQ